MQRLLDWVERGLIPETLVRAGIRRLLEVRLRQIAADDPEVARRRYQTLVQAMDAAPVAVETSAANQQHYEVPAPFYLAALGPHLKYSSCYFADASDGLGEAEAAMLALSCERARLEDGQRILELGCGWGSLTLWMAERYPAARITGISNSSSQREFILDRARERGLENVEIRTADMNHFAPAPGERFDRVVSVEMFEHMRNWRELFGRVASWLESDGRFFMHVFCHRSVPYFFEDKGASDWMARHFFTGGLMPAFDLPHRFDEALRIEEDWAVPGTHYAKTARAWLGNLDSRREKVEEIFRETYPPHETRIWAERWRVFFMACEELFGYRDGREWLVGHYRMRPRG